jgi:hypothetical protein
MIKTLTALILITSTFSISFSLDENVTQMCFFLRGDNIGKELTLNYEIVGEGRENVKFIMTDVSDNDIILQVEKQDESGEKSIVQKINFKHNFIICWKNIDSEKKEINFYYKQKDVVSYLDKDDVTGHRDLMIAYRQTLNEVNQNIKLQYSLEDYYTVEMDQQEKKIKMSYYLRAAILFIVVLAQGCVFLKLIDRKLKNIRDIIVGPR